MTNWKTQHGAPAPYPVKDSELALKREMWETGKQAVKWYVGANLVVLIVLLIPAIIAVICGLVSMMAGIGHDAAMTNAWMNRGHATLQAAPPAAQEVELVYVPGIGFTSQPYQPDQGDPPGTEKLWERDRATHYYFPDIDHSEQELAYLVLWRAQHHLRPLKKITF